MSFCRSLYGEAAGAVHASRAGLVTAAMPVTEIRSEASNPFYRWADRLTEAGLPTRGTAGLLVGQQSGYQSHLLRHADTAPADAARGLVDAVRGIASDTAFRARVGCADRSHAPAVAMFLGTEDVRLFRAAGVTAPPLLLQLDAWIPLGGGGWEGYLASLGSRRRAGAVGAERRRFEAAGYTVEHRPLGEVTQEIGSLLAQTERRYGNEGDARACARTFALQAAATDSRGEVLLCRDDTDRAVGFCLFYEWDGVVYLRAAGFDYARLRGVGEYFNLVYYRVIEIAAERGVRLLHAGIEAAEAKALRGAELRGLWMLDLGADSVLDGHAAEVRAANRAALGRMTAASRAVASAVSQDVYDLVGR
ncbi:GNAT family N-acetyltransferase [Kitasatospora purpeofusca]|uniref:GNAT family N-acetyltransferase n=1 Tax=Kitasatospora purpeofusca TaxID=67352 RepID=UPI0030F2CD8D